MRSSQCVRPLHSTRQTVELEPFWTTLNLTVCDSFQCSREWFTWNTLDLHLNIVTDFAAWIQEDSLHWQQAFVSASTLVDEVVQKIWILNTALILKLKNKNVDVFHQWPKLMLKCCLFS